MAVKREENKKTVFNSILFRSWVSFIILAIGIISAVWIGELVAFAALFRNMRVNQIHDTNEVLIEKLKNNDCKPEATSFRREVERVVTEVNMTVVVFRFDNEADPTNPYDSTILLYRNGARQDLPGDEAVAREVVTAEFLEKLNAVGESGRISYTTGANPSFNVIVGEKMLDSHGDTVYYMSTSKIVTNDATVVVLTSQFKVVTVVCLLVSVLVSFIIAWKFAKPVRDFTATAKKIGDGDLTVKYEGNGYNEFDDLADALNYSTGEIIKAENLRRDFLANVSHDLRTPLTLVKAYAEMIRDVSGDNKEKRDRNTQVIINEVDRLTMLVDDILDLSKLQSGTVQMSKEDVDLAVVIDQTIGQFAVMKDRGYVFDVSLIDGAIVTCDPKRMTQVMYNLVGNAINYVGEDNLVKVNLSISDGMVKTEVTDHGKGIPQEEIDKVWDRYYRSNQNKRNVVGSGIGLSIVKSILVSFGAEYGIESKEGEGTTFWFALPLSEASENSQEKPTKTQ